MEPQISVILCVFNAGTGASDPRSSRWLRESIESILRQTFTRFELIIVNDGSTDNTAEILSSFSDPRIRIITNERNQGLTVSLNRGLKEARGNLVARIDADDRAAPFRLQRQYEYLTAHPYTALVGSWAEYINEEGVPLRTRKTPALFMRLRYDLLFGNPFLHSSICFRKKEILRAGGYNPTFRHAQDYDLYERLAFEKNAVLENIPEPLIQYRTRAGSIVTNPKTQRIVRANTLRIIRRAIGRAVTLSDEDIELFFQAFIINQPERVLSVRDIFRALGILRRIHRAYCASWPDLCGTRVIRPAYRRRQILCLRKHAARLIRSRMRV